MKLISGIFAAAAIAVFSAGIANAAVLYDNGPVNGTIDAYTISLPFAVSNSFTLAQASIVTGVNFGVWTVPGEVVSTVDWAITSTSFSYPVDGTATVNNGALIGLGFGSYPIHFANFSTGSVSLASGTYYLVLQNALSSSGSQVYWDLNNGPSTATQSGAAIPGSQSFQILGTTSGAVPEASTWAMLIAGFGLVGAVARRRRNAIAA